MTSTRSDGPDTQVAPVLTGPKRQHYLPQFFLKGFLGDDECLAVFDRERNEIRRQQPVNTGAVGHLYTLTDDLGRQRFELEGALSQIEAAASEHLPALFSGGQISVEARGAIAHFVGTLATRTPEFIANIQHLNGELIKATSRILLSNEAQARHALAKNRDHAGLSEEELSRLARDLVDFAEGENYEVSTDAKWAMTMALPMGEQVAEIMAERQWDVWRAPPRCAFVLSDAPVVLTTAARRSSNFMGLGFASMDALVIVPLDSNHALAMHSGGRSNHLGTVSREAVRRVNLSVAKRTQRFLIGRDNPLVASISRAAGLEQTTWRPRMGTGFSR
ncbi:hypothetical protein C1925_01650 [Stenotrophomonas sp. SAU14A_NAIMI4_5]|uniref:DUF4238 domain-containing protein n=1 Tax=Stenotrophomonas sp. SAU14A_NAIMI4_5 TaxID=2072413 RepID=UPI000D53D64D|nr:DUF4238 domain-containing protein [Stenotrophomonas sp. SAU14A_NAIMI4_5]AWH47961.1 hypothetical protein C1925_01650 [Stenotrophomonas sp. SAU14A_NAIMI4_5]